MTTKTISAEEELNCLERFARSFLDDWLAPLIPAIPDIECFDPTVRGKHSHVLDVPGVTQVNTYSCGATASWSVLRAMGWKVSLDDWLQKCHRAGMSPSEGMDEVQLNAALKTVGARLRTHRYRNPDQIRRMLDAGSPILFGWDADEQGEAEHWMYAYGYTRNQLLVGNIVRPLVSKGAAKWADWRERLTPSEFYTISE